MAVIHIFIISSLVVSFEWNILNAYVTFDAACHERKGKDVDQNSKSHVNAAVSLYCARFARLDSYLDIGIEVNVHDTSQLVVSNREVGNHEDQKQFNDRRADDKS